MHLFQGIADQMEFVLCHVYTAITISHFIVSVTYASEGEHLQVHSVDGKIDRQPGGIEHLHGNYKFRKKNNFYWFWSEYC